MKRLFLFSIFLLSLSCKEQSANSKIEKTIKKQQWNLASSFPKSLDSFWERTDAITDNIEILSSGELKIRSYQPGELIPALEVFDAVSQGSIEMGISVGNYYMGKNTALLLDTGYPFGLNARQMNAWLYQSGGLELIQDLYKKYNIMYFPIGSTTTQMVGWFRKEINSLEDFKGLRIRISGLGGEVYNRLGATVQMISGGEIYSALEQGTLDGAEFVGPYDDEKFGFYNVAKYYYSPGWQEPSGSVGLFINLEKWNSLSKKTQKIIELSAKESTLLLTAKYDKENPDALERLKSNGVHIKQLNNKILEEVYKQTQELLVEYCKNPEFEKIYTSMENFKKKSNSWLNGNELNYLNFQTK